MDCRSFERWLDAGRPAPERGPATAHAATCAACGELEAADHALTAALGQRFASAPTGFRDRVLAALPDRRPIAFSLPLVEPTDPVPWLVRVLLQPSTALALALGGTMATQMDRLAAAATWLTATTTAWWASLLPSVPAAWASGLGVALGLGLLGTTTWGLSRLAEALIARVPVETPEPR